VTTLAARQLVTLGAVRARLWWRESQGGSAGGRLQAVRPLARLLLAFFRYGLLLSLLTNMATLTASDAATRTALTRLTFHGLLAITAGLTLWGEILRGTDAARRRLDEHWLGLLPISRHAETFERMTPTIELREMAGVLDQYTSGYSHGTKKKLALLAALVHEPPLLLLDEPTNGLDPPSALRVRELLADLADRGAGILVSTHLLDMADRLCQRAVILHRGRVLADASMGELRAVAGFETAASLEAVFMALLERERGVQGAEQAESVDERRVKVRSGRRSESP
jgi:ABC-type branched-subunit amino acid transport system ATPase component